jgi:hypothetical protein
MDAQSERLFVLASTTVSAGDGVVYDYLGPQPPAMQASPINWTGNGSISTPMMTMLEFMRRCVTNITTPSASINSGGSAGSVAINFGTATPSGIAGMFQGVPFVLSAAGTLSGSPTSAWSTASYQIRKVLVTIGMSGLSGQSSLALAGGTVQFTYGSAMVTSAMGCTSGSQAISYWDYVPWPLPSANEIPIGGLLVPNSTAVSAGIINSCMISDLRVFQGVNMSAMMVGVTQP